MFKIKNKNKWQVLAPQIHPMGFLFKGSPQMLLEDVWIATNYCKSFITFWKPEITNFQF